MPGYTKLFSSILASTIWRTDDKTRIVWITLLAMADSHGMVEGSVPGIADFARVSVEDCRKALSVLGEPDEDSRSKEHDGRRIGEVDGGFQILNYAKYRAKLGIEERREYLRVKQREHRAKRKMSTTVNNVSNESTMLTHTEAEAEAEANKNKSACVSPAAPLKAKPADASRDPFTDAVLTERAGRFLDRYELLYPKHRKGARYALNPTRDYAAAVELCRTWPDQRLDKLAVIFLTTDHQFAENGSRTVPQFRGLASWCDGKLAEWELSHGVKPSC